MGNMNKILDSMTITNSDTFSYDWEMLEELRDFNKQRYQMLVEAGEVKPIEHKVEIFSDEWAPILLKVMPKKSTNPIDFKQIKADVVAILSDWYYFFMFGNPDVPFKEPNDDEMLDALKLSIFKTSVKKNLGIKSDVLKKKYSVKKS